jgi:hypothetical protein
MKKTLKWIAFPILIAIFSIVNPYNAFAYCKLIEKDISENSVYLAQSNPLYGCWSLTFSIFGVVYESLLQMNGYSGVMITAFFNSNTNRTEYVQQTMKLQDSAHGLMIFGSNPVYAGTNIRHPIYSPDNFLFQVRPNGEYRFVTCDNEGRCSPVEMGACPQN